MSKIEIDLDGDYKPFRYFFWDLLVDAVKDMEASFEMWAVGVVAFLIGTFI